MSLSRQTSTGSSGSRKASIGSLNRKASTESTGSSRKYSIGSYNGIVSLTENISVLPKMIVFDLGKKLYIYYRVLSCFNYNCLCCRLHLVATMDRDVQPTFSHGEVGVTNIYTSAFYVVTKLTSIRYTLTATGMNLK